MGIRNLIVVSDTGPLLHLSEIGCINLLKYFDNIFIPESVRFEYYKHKKRSDPDVFELNNIELRKVQDTKVKNFIETQNLFNLHAGEKDCLYLCSKLSIDSILTDDLAVRDAAKKLKIIPVGSLGVIIRSFQENIIPLSLAEEHIMNLYEISSLFVTKTIVDLAIEELRKVKK